MFCSFKHYGHFTIWRWCFAFFLTHIVSESLCFLKKCRKYGRKVLRPLKSDQCRLEGTSKQFLKFGCKWWRCLDSKQLLPINLKAFQVLKILFYRFARNRTDKRRQSFSTISLKSIRENQSSMNVLKKNAFNKSFVFYRYIICFKEKQACGRNV